MTGVTVSYVTYRTTSPEQSISMTFLSVVYIQRPCKKESNVNDEYVFDPSHWNDFGLYVLIRRSSYKPEEIDLTRKTNLC